MAPPTVACLCALNEERTIRAVLAEVASCPLVDLVGVVVNGSTDQTAELARSFRPPGSCRVVVLEMAERLGHDAGRAVAAQWALTEGAEVLVFLDTDFVVKAADIAPFVQATRRGVDVALNGLSAVLAGWPSTGPVAAARTGLNAFLGRPDLGLDGLVAVPHALTRRAVETVAPGSLAVPPLALALAIMAGLTVEVVHTVNTVIPNRPSGERPRSRTAGEMSDLILGDHLEAISAILARRGARGGFSDLGRKVGPHRPLAPRQD
jgi:hypothetical protein